MLDIAGALFIKLVATRLPCLLLKLRLRVLCGIFVVELPESVLSSELLDSSSILEC